MRTPPGPERPQQPDRLAPIDEVLSCIDRLAQPVEPHELELHAAKDRVLAADLGVERPRPAAMIALRDGWAVRSDDVADASAYAPQLLELAPAWVDVGETLPDGTDAILSADAVLRVGGIAQAIAPAVAGQGVLSPGADARPGVPLRRRGERLRELDIAVLQTAGLLCCRVREPRVRVIATRPALAHVAALICRLLQRAGGRCERAASAGVADLERLLLEADGDATIVVGGTGSGREDQSANALGRVGTLDIHGFGLLPGHTAALGSVGGRAVLALPGGLDAALSVFVVVGSHLLARLTGLCDREPAGVKSTLSRKIVSTVGLAEVVPVAAGSAGVEPLASGYFPLTVLVQALGWVLVPSELEGYAAGSAVTVQPFC